MALEAFRRRGFLGGLAATMAGLAGCGEASDGTSGDRAPPDGAEHRAAQTTGTRTAIPPHDHSSQGTGGSVLTPAEVRVTEQQLPYEYVIYQRDGEVRAFDGRAETERFGGPEATSVIQAAVDDLEAGTILVKRGTYEIGPAENSWLGGILLHSNLRIVGEGPGATVFRLKDGVNGRRGEVRAGLFAIPGDTSKVTIEHLEIDGNESNNRDSPSYPLSPHHHGIVITGDSDVVPEDRKPSDILLRDLHVHDTVRSNIVLAGRNCELEHLWLSNSATDHWLYLAGATNCHIHNVHASGFARNEGIVFGVGSRRCYGNTLSDVTISNLEETPYQNDEPRGLRGRYPLTAIIFRHSKGFAHHNTIRDVRIELPEAEYGSGILSFQPHTTIDGLWYRGPSDEAAIVDLTPRAASTQVTDTTIEITRRQAGEGRSLILNAAPDVSITRARLAAPDDSDLAGIYLTEGPEPVARNSIRDSRISTGGPVIRVNRGEYGVPDLFVESVFDPNGRGTDGVDRIDPIRRGVY